jgi:hypothetical protein
VCVRASSLSNIRSAVQSVNSECFTSATPSPLLARCYSCCCLRTQLLLPVPSPFSHSPSPISHNICPCYCTNCRCEISRRSLPTFPPRSRAHLRTPTQAKESFLTLSESPRACLLSFPLCTHTRRRNLTCPPLLRSSSRNMRHGRPDRQPRT